MGVMIKVALEAELKLVMMEVDKEMNSEVVKAVILKLMQHRNKKISLLAQLAQNVGEPPFWKVRPPTR